MTSKSHMADTSNSRDSIDPIRKNAVQWVILVFWAVVIVVWTWYVSALAHWASAEDSDSITLWIVAVAPAAVAVWKYPTGRLFRAVFALVAFSVPIWAVFLLATAP